MSLKIISIDCGGHIFRTYLSTLTKYPNSKLSLMFSYPDQGLPPYVPPMQKTENGNYFLDENPDFFKVVLDFLRKGKVNWKDNFFSFDGVLDLATSFQLDELVEELSTVVLNLNGVKEIRISKKILK